MRKPRSEAYLLDLKAALQDVPNDVHEMVKRCKQVREQHMAKPKAFDETEQEQLDSGIAELESNAKTLLEEVVDVLRMEERYTGDEALLECRHCLHRIRADVQAFRNALKRRTTIVEEL